jgi:hypothetical protein
MAIAYKGNRGTKTGTTSAAGLATISPVSEALAGDLLVITVATLAGVSPLNVNDTQGNEWQVDNSLLNTARASICSCVLAFELTPADVISLNLGASLAYNLDLEEFSGVITPGQLGGTSSASGAGTALTDGSLTGSGTNVKVAAWAINAAESSFTPGGSMNAFGIVSQTGLGLFGQYIVSSGSVSPTGTAGTTGTWAGVGAVYLPGAAQPEERGPDPFLTR